MYKPGFSWTNKGRWPDRNARPSADLDGPGGELEENSEWSSGLTFISGSLCTNTELRDWIISWSQQNYEVATTVIPILQVRKPGHALRHKEVKQTFQCHTSCLMIKLGFEPNHFGSRAWAFNFLISTLNRPHPLIHPLI